tara:strand:- start:12689 stop:13225 length:537 start_codon:yes stop_codon:yes gene_type:complete
MNRKSKKNLTVYLSKDKINTRIKEIASQLSNEYFDECPVIIGVLNGSFIFLADLIRSFDFDCEIDFVKASSYVGKESLGQVKLDKDVTIDLNNRRVILVEDIIDSGLTIDYLYEHILSYNPVDITIVTLLSKKNSYKLNFNIDIIGFEIVSDFVVGYGLDLDHKFRNLDSIYSLEPKK